MNARERSILLRQHEVRGILDGRQTQLRRVIKPQPPKTTTSVFAPFSNEPDNWQGYCDLDGKIHWYGHSPYRPGDLLSGREPWIDVCDMDENGMFVITEDGEYVQRTRYKADDEDWCYYDGTSDWPRETIPWKSSAVMPRWASRITLRVTDVRVQRLQDISEEDARAEGCCARGWMPSYADPSNVNCAESISAGEEFAELWESIHGAGSFGANPLVWALTFERVKT